MIRMYTVGELENLSGFTRRTIGDYISKGLLAGPSHRGRGARYSQADADVLTVIPRLRTLMKKEFQNLRDVQEFLNHLSAHDLRMLARKSSEGAFVLAVRTLRVRMLLAAVLPQLAPERLAALLDELTPEQIRGVDTGRYQLGAVIDLGSVINELNGDGMNGNGHRKQSADADFDAMASRGNQPSWSVSWLGESGDDNPAESSETNGKDFDTSELDALTSRLERMASGTEMALVGHQSLVDHTEKGASTTAKLSEITKRVERLERLLEAK